jgi:hypothetical protein
VVAGNGENWNLSRLQDQPRLTRVFYQAAAFHTLSEQGISMSSTDGID